MPTLKNGPEPVIKADTFFDSCQLTITCMSNTKLNTVRTIHQPKFPEISVQNSMNRFVPTGKVPEKLVHRLRWSSFPGQTGLNFG